MGVLIWLIREHIRGAGGWTKRLTWPIRQERERDCRKDRASPTASLLSGWPVSWRSVHYIIQDVLPTRQKPTAVSDRGSAGSSPTRFHPTSICTLSLLHAGAFVRRELRPHVRVFPTPRHLLALPASANSVGVDKGVTFVPAASPKLRGFDRRSHVPLKSGPPPCAVASFLFPHIATARRSTRADQIYKA